MTFIELLILAVGLSMDAFAVSVCKGLAIGKIEKKHMVIAGLWFGGFQALMPAVGYLLGSSFAGYIKSIDHWVALVLLAGIGVNMLREAFSGEEETADSSMGFKPMLLMAVATSVDALAIGIGFAFLPVRIIPSVLTIGVTTFIFSAAGVKIGSVFGMKYRKGAELVGGVILILLGVKILLEHLGVLSF